MKKSKRMLFSLAAASVLALLLFGCGGNSTETETPTAESPAADVDLSTSADTFQLALIPQLLESPDAAIVEMFGESEDSTEDDSGSITGRTYSGILFGQDIRLVTTYDADTTTQIDLSFDSTEASLDQLAEAISDELGTADNEHNWESDGAAFSLNAVDGVPVLTVTMAE